jgi:hypothetical protein
MDKVHCVMFRHLHQVQFQRLSIEVLELQRVLELNL